MKVLQFLRHNMLLISTIIAVVLGIVAGMVCRTLKPSPDAIQLVQLPGELFLRMLKMLMLPLIIASIITGLGNIKGSSAGRIGVLSMVCYASTSVAATLVGLTLVLTIKPGAYSDSSTTDISHNNTMPSTMDILLDLIRNILPDNIVASTIQHSRTEMVVHGIKLQDDGNSRSTSGYLQDTGGDSRKVNQSVTAKKTVMVDGANIIGVITYCIVFAVTLGQLGRRGAVVTQFFTAVNIVSCKMIRLVMWYSPLGILFLVMGQIMSTSDMTETGHTLAIYIATELAGLAIHSLVVLPGLYFILTRKNPYAIYLKVIQALLTAFATSSSYMKVVESGPDNPVTDIMSIDLDNWDAMTCITRVTMPNHPIPLVASYDKHGFLKISCNPDLHGAATLPVTMQCVETRMKMDTRISRFILPVGATVNMDGSAVYVAIAPMFIAQYNGISLSFGDVIIVSLTAVLNSIGSAGVPGIGYAVLLLVLNSIGLPDRGISFLVTVDWLIDRFRTAVNVASDCLVVGVVSHYTELPPRDPSETQSEPQQEEEEMLENDLV